MLRVYCREWKGSRESPDLDREELHHLSRVRRVRDGEAIEVLNGCGAVGEATVHRSGNDPLEIRLHTVRQLAPLAPRVHLLVALPKGKTFPTILQKAVELGVSRITPLQTAHVEADASRSGRKGERWEAILREAVKQSGNPWLPQLDEPCSLEESLQTVGDGPSLCAALQPDASSLWKCLEHFGPCPETIAIFIGPEGDFSPAEYASLRDAGCRFVTLGPLVLKVDTAASLVAGTLRLWGLGRD